MNKTFLAIIVCAILAVVVFFLADFSLGKTFATPEEVIDAIRVASQKDDLRGWCECLTEQSRDFVAANVVLREFVEKKNNAAVLKVLTDHGLTEEHLSKVMQQEGEAFSNPRMPLEEKLKAAAAIVGPARDRNGLIVDLFRAIQKTDRSADPLAGWKSAKLLEVQIDGKTAVGVVSMGEGQPEQIAFRKEGDSWRLDLFAPRQPKGMPPGFQHPPMER